MRTYVIFKDGEYLANTTETTYTVAEDGVYTIRTANEMGGLSKDETRVTVGANALEKVKAEDAQNGKVFYNLSGQKVNDSYKGIVIVNGKKLVSK